MVSFPTPICEACAHLSDAGPRGQMLGFACSAFPDGIPDEINPGGFDHRQPYDGDGGVRFELRPGAGDVLAAYEASH